MKRVKNNATVEVMGVKFFGVREMIRYARSERPKYGVYVGEDSERYPCFDYEDYATENRYYTNLVFADSREELERKLNRISPYVITTSSLPSFTRWHIGGATTATM